MSVATQAMGKLSVRMIYPRTDGDPQVEIVVVPFPPAAARRRVGEDGIPRGVAVRGVAAPLVLLRVLLLDEAQLAEELPLSLFWGKREEK